MVNAFGEKKKKFPKALFSRRRRLFARRAQIPFLIFNLSFFVFNLNSRTGSQVLVWNFHAYFLLLTQHFPEIKKRHGSVGIGGGKDAGFRGMGLDLIRYPQQGYGFDTFAGFDVPDFKGVIRRAGEDKSPSRAETDTPYSTFVSFKGAHQHLFSAGTIPSE